MNEQTKNNISYIKDMIENIKRFAHEHHTLIVVIISVLVISFLFWWFCCKDRPLSNKVRGGTQAKHVGKAAASYKRGYICRCIGADCKPIGIGREGGRNLIVISDSGIDNIGKLIGKARDFHLSYLYNFCLLDDNEVKEQVPEGGEKGGSEEEEVIDYDLELTDTKFDNIETIGLFEIMQNPIKVFGKNLNRMREYTETEDGSFDFEKLLKENFDENVCNDIIGCYCQLIDIVVSVYRNCFDEVSYVGQLGKTKLSDSYEENIPREENMLCSRSRVGVIKGLKFKTLFDDFINNDSNIRAWYRNDGIADELIDGYYYNEINGNIVDVGDDDEFKAMCDSYYVVDELANVVHKLKTCLNAPQFSGNKIAMDTYVKNHFEKENLRGKEALYAEGVKAIRDSIVGNVNSGAVQTPYSSILITLEELLNEGKKKEKKRGKKKEKKRGKKKREEEEGEEEEEEEEEKETLNPDPYSEIKSSYPSANFSVKTSLINETYNSINKKNKFEVADIYPAYKLALCVFLLMLLYPNVYHECEDINKYKKLLASYVLFVNSFNTFCNVKMEKSWNTTIKNEFVYKKIINGQSVGPEMDIDLENLFKLELRFTISHYQFLKRIHPELNVYEEVNKAIAWMNMDKDMGKVVKRDVLVGLGKTYGIEDKYLAFDGLESRGDIGEILTLMSEIYSKAQEGVTEDGSKRCLYALIWAHVNNEIYFPLCFKEGRKITATPVVQEVLSRNRNVRPPTPDTIKENLETVLAAETPSADTITNDDVLNETKGRKIDIGEVVVTRDEVKDESVAINNGLMGYLKRGVNTILDLFKYKNGL